MRTLPIILLFLLPSFWGKAQGRGTEEGKDVQAEIRNSLVFGGDEFLVGVGAGAKLLDERYHAGLSLFMRPQYLPRVHEQGETKVQYQERRYAALLQFEYRFKKEISWELLPFAGLSTGPAIEERRGFPGEQGFHWLIVPRGGFSYPLASFLTVELEYRFSPEEALNGVEHLLGFRTLIEL